MTAKPAPEVTGVALMRAPFPANQISKLPKESRSQIDARKTNKALMVWNCQVCGGAHHKDAVHLDYVGHAALTDRLLDADPQWSWEPVAFGPDGNPAFDRTGGLWIKLTVCGVTRLGYGSADGKTGGDAVKEMIGDALRNAAMRFGAALDLWHKGDLHVDEPEAEDPCEPKAAQKPAPKAGTLTDRANRLANALMAAKSPEALRKAYSLGSGLCAELDLKSPEDLAEIEALYANLLDALTDADFAKTPELA